MLSFQTLDVYRCAIDFLALSDRLLAALPRGQASRSDPLPRAAMSIPLNIAEAQGEPLNRYSESTVLCSECSRLA